MIREIYSQFFPAGTKRSQVLKKLLIRDPEKPSSIESFLMRLSETPVCKGISKTERELLFSLKDKFRGERCFIIGNGPSLNKCDLTALSDEFTFGVNGIFYKTDEIGFVPKFYVVEDSHVIDDNLDRINQYDVDFKFFPSIYKDKIKNLKNTFFFSADLGFYRKNHKSFGKPRFSERFDQVAFVGQSVTYLNLQLAYFLGFTEVYLVGMDFSYDIPDTAIKTGETIQSTEDDPNHFHPEYFGSGKKWHDPKIEMVGLNYRFAKQVYERNGRKIFNATHGGNLELFERVNFDSIV